MHVKPVMFAMEAMSLGGVNLPPAKTKQIGSVTYHRYPVAVIGRRSDNGTFYNAPAFMNAVNKPEGLFYKSISTGVLFSELDHPDLSIYKNDSEVIRRLHTTIQDNYCGHIESIELSKPMSDGAQIVFAWITPHGLKKAELEDCINNPAVNTSFSLRSSLANETYKNNTKYRDIDQLVTFDKVPRGGFPEASKKFAGLENFSVQDVRRSGVHISATVCAFESISNTEINDVLESSSVYFLSKTLTHMRSDTMYMVNDRPTSPASTLKHMGISI